MLKSLYIKNIALIDTLSIEFSSGMNVISGETGAGKSLIADSLSFVLGERADKNLIKHGSDSALVEAVFDLCDVKHHKLFTDMGYDLSEGIIVTRTLNINGKNEIRINGRPATILVLRQFSGSLIDILGQSEHLNILNELQHLKIIDSYGVDAALVREVADIYGKYKYILNELDSFGGSGIERARLIDLYEYQIEEIDKAKLDAEEEKNLIEMRSFAVNQEKVTDAVKSALGLIVADETAACDTVSRAMNALNSIKRYVSSIEQVEDLAERLQGLRIELQDIAESLEIMLEKLSFNKYDAEVIEKRIEEIKSLKRKYGDFSELINYRDKIGKELKRLNEAEETIIDLNAKKIIILEKAYELSLKLRGERIIAAEKLSKEIIEELARLSIPDAKFCAKFNTAVEYSDFHARFNVSGMDSVTFMFSANKGAPLKPLAKVMSGGEMSRFMLAVKSITALSEGIPTIVLDEIDSGISGRTAQAVADKLINVSSRVQSIIISHLPQIVAAAETNILIEKTVTEDKTLVSAKKLSKDGRINEVTRLIGDTASAFAELHASELINYADSLRNLIVK